MSDVTPLACWARLGSEENLRVVRAEGSRVSFSRPYVSGAAEWDPYDWVDPGIGTIEQLKPVKGGVIASSASADAVFYCVTQDSTGNIFNYRVRLRGWRPRAAGALRRLAKRLES